MRALILDFYGRWFWLLALVAFAQFALGGLIAADPEYAFEFWAFLVALWAGANLLSFDLRRGLLRAVATLPLTGRQIGVSWWLATVPLPAAVLSASLFLGAALGHHFSPGHHFPADRLALNTLFTLVWLGLQFFMIFNATRGFGENRRQFITNSIIGWITVVIFFGSMLLCQNASKSLFKTVFLLTGGGLLSLLGWICAVNFETGRAGIYLGRMEPPKRGRTGAPLPAPALGSSRAQCSIPTGVGGVPRLLGATFLRGLISNVIMVGIVALISQWQGHSASPATNFAELTTIGSYMACWFVLFFQFMPLLGHLRFLRTLPLSSASLAVVMLALALLPVMGLGVLLIGIAWVAQGNAAALTVMSGLSLTLPSIALGACFALWLGGGAQAYAAMLLTLVGSLILRLFLECHSHSAALPPGQTGGIALLGLLLALALMRLALTRNGHACRPAAADIWRT
jgi:hypothetical protein